MQDYPIEQLAAFARPQEGRTAIEYAVGDSVIGAVLVAMSADGICAVLPGDDAAATIADLDDRFDGRVTAASDTVLGGALASVLNHIDDPRGVTGRAISGWPLDMGGTPFQRRVWQALQTIPAGSTASYGEIAAQIGVPGAVRAVARACAANRLAVLVPCHRVVRADGSLSGYRWGTARKRILLTREAAR